MVRAPYRTARRSRSRWLVLPLAVVLACLSATTFRCVTAAYQAGTPAVDWRLEIAPSILASLAASRDGSAGVLVREEAPRLAILYAPGRGTGLWIDAQGSRGPDARAALALLAAAGDHGFDPADYDVPGLSALGAAIDAEPPDRARLAAFDVRLSAATLHYLRHLHLGRVDPRMLGVHLTEPEPHDFAGLLQAALASHALPALAERLSPQLPQYRALRRQLARYRSIADPADAAAWSTATRSLHPGDSSAAAGSLRRYLAVLGDLPDAAEPSDAGALYDDALAEGVRRFQAHHGLTPDGVLGRATAEALAVPVRRRLRQIELALERLRWLPDLGAERVIALNIPMFRLTTWDGAGAAGPALRMRAIVGRALFTETPVFTALMRSVIFRPYWNVPRSILLQEILPELERDPGRIRRYDLEIVNGETDEADAVPPTPAAFAELRQGTLRLRQRPGPGNSLGLVKFDFPNDHGVYLHGTPAVELFDRSRRDFSHGCVRVEDPATLAVWVLRDVDGWDRGRVDAAMHATVTSRVALSKPIRVILFYTTAAVAEDGTVYFAADIYGHDARLADALARRRRSS